MYNDCLIFKFLGFKCTEEKASSKARGSCTTVKIFRRIIGLEIQSHSVNECFLFHLSKCDFNMPNWSAMHKPLKIFTIGARE